MFWVTLDPFLFLSVQDSTYNQPLSIPMAGLALKTRVFAAVKATNLDKRYHLIWSLLNFDLIRWYQSVQTFSHNNNNNSFWGSALSRHDVNHSVFPIIILTDLLLFFSLPALIMPLCYYSKRRRQLAAEKVWLVFSHVQFALYPSSHLIVLSPCRWNILMDYCYTTPSGNPNDELRYDLFFG